MFVFIFLADFYIGIKYSLIARKATFMYTILLNIRYSNAHNQVCRVTLD